jgi:hypothetical protein
MLHPIDYRLSKNKFWLSTWNSYSLKNYKNLILNDKILNILGYIFKNCFKVSYSFASPWSNPRKYRKYFSNFIIGFDGRRAIRTGPNKVKKLPGFIIPEDYNVIRFNNFSILKIYFLIDKNLETYWTKKQKNWRAPLKYFNMRYTKNKNSEENFLKLNKNLVNNNIEKKNFKITSFFIYLINLLNNNSVKQHLYLDVSEQINFFKKDTKHLYFKFYYDNFKLLNKIRNNYFLFYLLNKNNNNTLDKLGLVKNKKSISNLNYLNTFYFKDISNKHKYMKTHIKNNCFSSKISYNDLLKYSSCYTVNKQFNSFNFYKYLLNKTKIKVSSLLIKNQELSNNIRSFILFNNVKGHIFLYNKNFSKNIVKNINSKSLNYYKKYNFSLKRKIKPSVFYFNTNRKFGIGLFCQNSSFSNLKLQDTKYINCNIFKKGNDFIDIVLKTKTKGIKKLDWYNKNWELNLLNNRLKLITLTNYYSFIYQKQNYKNYKYFLKFLKNKNNKKTDFSIFKKLKSFNNSLKFHTLKIKNYKNSIFYLQNFFTNYSLRNWLNFSSIMYLTTNTSYKKKKKKNHQFKKSINNVNKISFFFKSITNFLNSSLLIGLTKNQKFLLIKKNMYSYLNRNSLEYKKVNKKIKKSFKKKNLYISKNSWGKIFWSITNFNKKKNYLYYAKNYYELNSRYIQKITADKIIEYNSFLKVKNFNIKGYNLYLNKNYNFSNSILNNYNCKKSMYKLVSTNNHNFLNIKFHNGTYSEKIILFKNSINNKILNNLSKNFQSNDVFNLSYKKTFSKFLKNQEIFSKENLDRINYRLENYSKNQYAKLQKFKPYSFKSISKMHRYKLNKFILTSYLFNSIKKKYIFDFFKFMESKKHLVRKTRGYKLSKGHTLSNSFKIRGSVLLNNLSVTRFNELNVFNYSVNSFNKKLKTLLFFNKKLKIKDSYFFLSKNKNKHFLFNYIDLIGLKNIYINYLQKLKFNYFKSQNFFKIHTYTNNHLSIKPFKSLLYNKSYYNFLSEDDTRFYNKNYNSNLLLNFKTISYKRNNYSFRKINNLYKYKLNIYNYFKSNKKIELKQLYIPFKWKNKEVLTLMPIIFKKSFLLNNKKFMYTKSNNLLINKYIRSRLFNVFLSKKYINKVKKITKIKSEDFNYRIYGLVKKFSDVKPLTKKDFKKINILQPKTFLYWKHLKWFNLFIKTKFNFKFNTFYNHYSIFKLYEGFKNLNFSHYKNYKKVYNFNNYNLFSSFKYNYQKLNNLVFYSTIFKSKRNFLFSNNNKIFHKKTLLLNWAHDIMFFSSSSKRLNYIPHIRFKPIKDSIYMWRIDLRKLNLLSKYYKARTKFYKNKLNFVSNYTIRINIISYLKVMESNFIRIKKSMQRELPLIYTKRYLLTQFKKLNSYIKVLLRRQKKRLNYGLKQKNGFLKNTKKNNNSVVILKENEILSKKLFTFVRKRFFLGKKNLIDYVKKFIEHLFLIIFKFNNLRLFYIKKYQINIMSTKAKLFKNLFNYRLATGFKIPFLVKVICKKLNFDKSLVGCKIGFFGRYSKKLRNRKIWKYVKHLKPSVISTPLDYYNILILQKWGITGIKLSMLKKKTFNFIFTN